MFFNFYFQKIHFIFVFHFFIELSKRLIKDQQNKLFNDNYFRNLQMFLSHTISILFYLIQNKNSGKEINENKQKIFFHFPSKNILNNEKKKNIKKKSLLLIFLSSILHIISYSPLKENIDFFSFLNLKNTVGLFVIILFLVEKKMLKSKFSSHHILSFILLIIITALNINKEKTNISFFINILIPLVIYSIYHYLTLALVYNIYYFINNNYFISLYYISGIQGLISFILTISLIIIYYLLFQKCTIIEIYKNIKLSEYIWPFLVFICMSLQNILQILILYFFKPSFICIIYAILPIINITSYIIKLIIHDDYISQYKNTNILFEMIYVILSLISVLIYIEILVLNFCGFDKGVKEKITIRSEIEKKDLNALEMNYSIEKEQS